MEVKLLAITNYLDGDNPEQLVEHAGRACYRSTGNASPSFIRRRMDAGHESIVEHVSATFEISGASRACSHQLVRHRIGCSYSQESQRYVGVDGKLLVVTPESIRQNEQAHAVWRETMQNIVNAYRVLRNLGVLKEDARFVLPNATATRIVVTMNLRALLNFFRLRLDPAAQWEIRALAGKMLELVRPYAPTVFEEFHNEA